MGTNKNLYLRERGFGKAQFGESVIIVGHEGQRLTLRLVTFPDGNKGGELVVPPTSELKKNPKSFINTQGTVYEIKVTRYTKNKKTDGPIRIRKIDPTNNTIEFYESFFEINENDEFTFIESSGFKNAEEAKALITGILWEAFNSALQRASTPKPNGLFYGSIAKDASPLVLEKFEKTKQEVAVS